MTPIIAIIDYYISYTEIGGDTKFIILMRNVKDSLLRQLFCMSLHITLLKLLQHVTGANDLRVCRLVPKYLTSIHGKYLCILYDPTTRVTHMQRQRLHLRDRSSWWGLLQVHDTRFGNQCQIFHLWEFKLSYIMHSKAYMVMINLYVDNRFIRLLNYN